MAKKLYEENNIKDIANAIRQKGVSGTFKTSEMPQAILNIKSGGGEPILEDLEVKRNGIYTPSAGYDGFSKVTVDSACFWFNPSPYLDDDGKFVKPDEWDDIESIELSDNAQEVYYLYDNTKSLSWCSIRVTTSGSKSFCDYGRVRNGVFEILLTETKSSGSTYQKVFTDTFPNEDYIVLRFRPTTGKNLTRLEPNTYAYNSRSLSQNLQPLLMRYGNMPYAQIITCNMYNLVSDNLMNCGALTTLANLYTGCNMLVRHRHKNWNTTNVTTLSAMFSNCYCLVDCDTDFSGWLSGGKCTSLATFMNNCYSLRGEVNVTGWVTDNVTNIQTLFYNCRNIVRIKGIEGWYLPRVVVSTTSHYPLNQLFSLEQENGVLDLRNWRLGESVTNTQIFANFFDTMRRIKEIDISTWNMKYVSNLNNFCPTCYALKKITFPDDVGSGGLLTTMNTIFNNCYSLESIDLSTFDMSKIQTMNNAVANCYSLKEFIPPTTTPAGTSGSSAFTAFGNYSLLETLDLSWVDASKFTNATSQINDIVKQAIYLKELYPPRNIFKAFNVGFAPNLSKASLLRIINNLSTVSSATTLTLGTTNLAKLTTDELAVATGKGWTIA